MDTKNRSASGAVLPLDWLLCYFGARTRRAETLFVGIDGRGGSGKTSLAGALAALSAEVSFVSLNDFYIPVERQVTSPPDRRTSIDDTDHSRLFAQLIDPLRRGLPGHYQRWDMRSEALAEWHDLAPGGVVILEGVGATCHILRPYLDAALWLACPKTTRVQRGLLRDGETMRNTWETQWLPAGDRYESLHQPLECADLVIDSSGETSHDPKTSFVLVQERERCSR